MLDGIHHGSWPQPRARNRSGSPENVPRYSGAIPIQTSCYTAQYLPSHPCHSCHDHSSHYLQHRQGTAPTLKTTDPSSTEKGVGNHHLRGCGVRMLWHRDVRTQLFIYTAPRPPPGRAGVTKWSVLANSFNRQPAAATRTTLSSS